jgi:hypothetical protein
MPKTNEVKSIVVDRYIEKPIPLYNISVSAEEFYQKMNIITSTYGVNLTRIEDHSSIIEHTYNTSDMTKFNTILTLGSEHLESNNFIFNLVKMNVHNINASKLRIKTRYPKIIFIFWNFTQE